MAIRFAVSAVFEDSSARESTGNQADNSVAIRGRVRIHPCRQQLVAAGLHQGVEHRRTRRRRYICGYTHCLSGDGATLAVGAQRRQPTPRESMVNQATIRVRRRRSIVFTRNANAPLSQQAYVRVSVTRANSLFGYSVALSNNGDTLATGAFDEDGEKARLYLHARRQCLVAAGPAPSLKMPRGRIPGIMGCHQDDGNTVAAGGALDEEQYAHGVNLEIWAQRILQRIRPPALLRLSFVVGRHGLSKAFIKASNTGKERLVGVRLALSGDGNTLASERPQRRQRRQRQSTGSRMMTGSRKPAQFMSTRGTAVHGAIRSTSRLEHRQFDEFGSSVALGRDVPDNDCWRTLRRQRREGSNGNQADNSLSDSGAVYMFVR